MGLVSLCRDNELGRNVALKELLPDNVANEEMQSRFLQEARITSQLEHPSIVPVYELVRPAGQPPFYTMRFVKGRRLTDAAHAHHENRRAGADTRLNLLTLLNAFVSVCNAVAYAHSQGVIHRDLKGQNVVLGDFGEVIVLDWGLAKRLDDGPATQQAQTSEATVDHPPSGPENDRLTRAGALLGTPAYMSPEAAASDLACLDERTDVYGLGALLYEILTGQPPFTADTQRALLLKVQEEKPAAPRSVVHDVPPALEAACLRALAKRPADRHASVSDLARDVQQWLAESAERSRAEQERERFFNLSRDLLCTIGPDDRLEQVSPAWEKTLGRAREELRGRSYLELVHPDDHEATAAQAKLARTGVELPAFENRYLCKDDSWRWISWMVNRIPGEQQLLYAVGRDVTERKSVEEALRRSQERFDLAVRGSGDGLWDWDRETGISYYSPRWKSMLGYEDHELSHDLEEWKKRLHEEDRARVLAALDDYVNDRAPTYEIEYRLQHKDGSYRWILDRGVGLRDANRKVYRMAGSHVDVTERKKME
jgi:serine/threonine-protein kinase